MKYKKHRRSIHSIALLAVITTGSLGCAADKFKVEKLLPPQIQGLPTHDTSKIKTYIANSRTVRIFSADSNHFVQEQIRYREMVQTLLDGADTQQLGFLVERCPPQRAAPQLRGDERPTIVHVLVKLGEPFFATDFDPQARYEQQLTTPESLLQRQAATWANPPYELVGEISALDDHVIELEREGEIGVLMNVFHKVFEPSGRRNAKVELSVLRFTLRVRSSKTRFFVPGAEARVSAVVGRWTGTTRLGLIVANSGGSITGTATYTDGMDSVSDALVSRATLTVIGKLLGLPVHRVIAELPAADPEIQRATRLFFARMGSRDQTLSLQHLLSRNGYTVTKTGTLDAGTMAALTDFASKHGVPGGSGNLKEVYVKLMEHTPLPFEPIGADPESPRDPEGVAVLFQGFPSSDAPVLAKIIHNAAGRRRVQPAEGTPFQFKVDYAGRPEDFGAYLPSMFFRQTGRACSVEAVEGRRLIVRHVSGFNSQP